MSSKRLGINEQPGGQNFFLTNLLCYRKLVCTGVASPFVVSSLSRNDEEVRTVGTEQHHGPVTSVTGATTYNDNDDLTAITSDPDERLD